MVKSVKKPAKAEFPLNLVEKKPRTFSIGGDILPKQALTRFVKWPKYIRIQRSRRVLYQRIKIPPAINQFKPESRSQKAERIADAAAKKAAGDKSGASKKPVCVKMGINHVTKLVEEKED